MSAPQPTPIPPYPDYERRRIELHRDLALVMGEITPLKEESLALTQQAQAENWEWSRYLQARTPIQQRLAVLGQRMQELQAELDSLPLLPLS